MRHFERFLRRIHRYLAVIRANGLALPGYWQKISCLGQDFVATVLGLFF